MKNALRLPADTVNSYTTSWDVTRGMGGDYPVFAAMLRLHDSKALPEQSLATHRSGIAFCSKTV